MEIGARNTLKGKTRRITQGAVNTEVVVELSNGVEVVSIITKESAEGRPHASVLRGNGHALTCAGFSANG